MATLTNNISSSPWTLFTTFLISLLVCFWIYNQLRLSKRSRSLVPTNWPVLGMLPAIIKNARRLHDLTTEGFMEVGSTFEFKGPWFANLDMILTCDPANVQYILSKNFSNYPKGPEFRKIFDIFGDAMINTDWELGEFHRKVTVSVIHTPEFVKFTQETVLQKLEKGVLPVLEKYADKETWIDLQDVLERLTFDLASILFLDHDPESLSVDLPCIPARNAFLDIEKAVLQRHLLPECFWKLQKWLGFGKEQKLSEARVILDKYIYPCIDKKWESLKHAEKNSVDDRMDHFDGLAALAQAFQTMRMSSSNFPEITQTFVRDSVMGLLVAGKDTISTGLTWFFYLMSKNPSIEAKILHEIKTTLTHSQPIVCNSAAESQKLVYLHGALCETLRLYPPVPLQHKAPAKPDILPSGVRVNADTKVILFYYAMGRMESVWGEDCLEFKPERWITEQGKIRNQPAFKFPAFHAGPRSCLGKEISFVQMKMIAASIIHNYSIHVVANHPVTPADSVILQMKHGLKVKVHKRI